MIQITIPSVGEKVYIPKENRIAFVESVTIVLKQEQKDFIVYTNKGVFFLSDIEEVNY